MPISADIIPNTQLKLFYQLLRVRLVEETIVSLYSEQEIRCPTHFSIGQEAIGVGTCFALRNKDHVLSAHRSHCHYLAKGGDLNQMMAELYGKETGCTGGKGGSMHLIDKKVNFHGCVPIVGSTISIAAGISMGNKIQLQPALTVVFFGDAATETGQFYESLNFASVQQLPLIFICENNLYSVCTGLEHRQSPERDNLALAQSLGIEFHSGDGQDLNSVFKIMSRVIERARGGNGPQFVEFSTYRTLEHCGPNYDTHLGFRPQGELETWQSRCPVHLYQSMLENENQLSEMQLEDMKKEIYAEISIAVEFAKNSPFPPRENLTMDVFA